jgi:hypothetical protein
LILHAVGENELSLKFLEHALALNIKYFGPKSLKVAVSYHLVARTQSCMGDFRSALNSEKETYAIYKQQVRLFSFYHIYQIKIIEPICSSEKVMKRLKNQVNVSNI